MPQHQPNEGAQECNFDPTIRLPVSPRAISTSTSSSRPIAPADVAVGEIVVRDASAAEVETWQAVLDNPRLRMSIYIDGFIGRVAAMAATFLL
jgi:hypothetical protein